MGIFRKKPIYKYKMLEPVKIDIDEAVDRSNQEFDNCCGVVAECDDYLFYNYEAYPDGSGGYVLRQNKKKPKEIVFFGRAKLLNCVFYNHLFQVNKIGDIGGSYQITCKNVFTGKLDEFAWFGKGRIWSHHVFNQDQVFDMYIEEEKLVLLVHRRKDNTPDFAKKHVDDDDPYNIDTNYKLIITVENNFFKPVAYF